MRRSVLAAAVLGVAFTAAAGLRADPPPYLDFVRGLRTRGLADIAVEYLTHLKENPPAGLSPTLIDLELAKARFDLASTEGDDSKRAAAYETARKDLEALLARIQKQSADEPYIPQIQIELARLIAARGKDCLARAERLEGPARILELGLARPLFADAAGRLATAGQLIDEKLKKLGETPSPDAQSAIKELTQARLRADLEQGMLLVEQAKTYPGDNERIARGEVLQKAQAVLQQLADGDQNQPISWIARAWVGRCFLDLDTNDAAEKALDDVLAAKTNRAADAGRRLAGYFKLLLQIKKAGRPTAPNQSPTREWLEVQKQAEDWLTQNRGFYNSPEGQAVRYLLAYNLEHAYSVVRDRKTGQVIGLTGAARGSLGRAERMYQRLADTENNYTERATRARVRIQMLMLYAASGGRPIHVAALTTFEDCYLAAQIEAFDVSDDQKRLQKAREDLANARQATEAAADDAKAKAELAKTKKALDAALSARRGRFERIIDALTRAQQLATPRDSAKRVFDAQVMRVYANLLAGHPYAAAVLGEYTARSHKQMPKAATAALYALQAYSQLIDEQKKRGDDETERKADERRLTRLAKFMDVTWPTDPATDFARQQLGNHLAEEGQYAEACAIFARVSPSYSNLYTVRLDEGQAAFKLSRPQVPAPAAAKANALARAISDLTALPVLPGGAPDDLARTYYLAQVRLGYLLLIQGRDFGRLEKLGTQIQQLVAKGGALADDEKAEFILAGRALELYGLWGSARLLARAGKHEDVIKLLGPKAKAIHQKMAKPEGNAGSPALEQLKTARRQLLLVLLRSEVQAGKIAEATELLQDLRAASGGTDISRPLAEIVRQIQGQLLSLREKKDQDAVAATEKGFALFLDELAKAPNLTPDALLSLSQGYSSVGQHRQAIAQLRKYPVPKDRPADDRSFRTVQYLIGRELRLAKQFPRAKAHVEQLLKDGYKMIDLRFELIFNEEDQGHFAAAMSMWQKLRTTFGRHYRAKPANPREVQINSLYFEIEFYTVRCQYKSLHAVRDPQERQNGLVMLGKMIARLDTAEMGAAKNRQRFVELVQSDPELRKTYVTAGGKAFLGEGQGQ